MKEISLLNTRPLARRSPLVISALLHAALISLLTFTNAGAAKESSFPVTHRRSVILLNLRDFRYPARPRTNSAQGQQALARAGRPGSDASLRFQAAPAAAQQNLGSADDQTLHAEQPHRRFQLSVAVPVVQQKQTIVQLDVPPDIVLKQNVPLPNIVVWTAQEPPLFRRKFIAPPLKQATPKVVAQNVAPAPELQLPNNEPNVADLKMASWVTAQNRHILVPPATTAPIKIPNPEPSTQVPQIIVPDSNLTQSAALIALVESPIKPNGMIIVPPANQTGESSGSAGPGQGSRNAAGNGSGSEHGGNSASKTGDGNAGSGNGGAGARGSGELAMNGHGGRGTGNGLGGEQGGATAGTSGTGSSSGLDSAASTGSGSGNGGVGVGSGAGKAGAGSSDGFDADAPVGFTRIILPKDGRYGVVVSGSSQAVPYPETVGALSGKMVYTVYLNVGLHKKWILQYCLTKESASSIPRGSSTAVDAPWPFLIFRPDHLEQPSDYVIVHGQIDKDGRFDQLAMVFPEQFDQKDLLINSLKLWAFRAASRDRVATAVEVLLIIPGES
jgi:hypothetical protein